ncbi:MAG TPA: hypothetical protein DCW90_03615 [Lachnospiraceae bacterium]|nr:hypothetical protein [Lachnospiraceae bacterium]
MTNTFKYNGFTFKPVRKLKITEIGYRDFSSHIDSAIRLPLDKPYDYNLFYKAAENSPMDVFQCLENGKYYVPCDNGLMGFREGK